MGTAERLSFAGAVVVDRSIRNGPEVPMNSHVAIAIAVFGVLIAPSAWFAAKRAWRARRPQASVEPERIVAEQVTPSESFKVVAYSRSNDVLRVQAFRRVGGGPAESFWVQVGTSSFADRGSLAQVMRETLQTASGESIAIVTEAE